MTMKNETKTLDKKIKKEIKTGNVKSAIELCQIGLQKILPMQIYTCV